MAFTGYIRSNIYPIVSQISDICDQTSKNSIVGRRVSRRQESIAMHRTVVLVLQIPINLSHICLH